MDEPLAIFGGTFDPVHYGHLRLAEVACASLGLSEVSWIPAGRTPHRGPPQVSAEHRLAMVQLATAGNPRFTVDACEVASDAPSYSVTTLARLRAQCGPKRPLVLLVGADAFAGIGSWHRYREIFELAHVAVATRPGYALDAAIDVELPGRLRTDFGALKTSPAGGIVPFAITALDISATAIRDALAVAASVRYLLPDPVLDYIGRNRLYQN